MVGPIEAELPTDGRDPRLVFADAIGRGLAFDLDELAYGFDPIQRHGIPPVRIPLSAFLDVGHRGESQRFEDGDGRLRVGHVGLELLSGFRGGVDPGPLVRERRAPVTIVPAVDPMAGNGSLATESERFVGTGERPGRVVEVRIDLLNRPSVLGIGLVEVVAEFVDIGRDLDLDFEHGSTHSGSVSNLFGRPGHGIDGARLLGILRTIDYVSVKGRTGLGSGMSEEPEPDEADEGPASQSADAGEGPDDSTDAGGDEAAESSEADEGDAVDGLADGDFVRLAYTIRTVEDGTLVDTTDEAIAEDEGIDTEEQSFEPRVIVVGAGHMFDAVEDALVGQTVGGTGTVTIAASDAFGEFDPDQVRTVSTEKLPEDQRYPGARVNVDGQVGHVETVIGGRARVDFNHPLAGEEIEYEYEILEAVEDPVARAQSLLGNYLDTDLEVSIETDEAPEGPEEEDEEEPGERRTLYIEATPELSMNQQWLFSKQQIAQELIDRLDIDRVVVREVLDGSGGFGGLAGLGGADLEDAVEDADLEEADLDAEELAEELASEADLEADEPGE